MAKTLSLSEVKTRLPELIAGVQDREEEIVVTGTVREAADGKAIVDSDAQQSGKRVIRNGVAELREV